MAIPMTRDPAAPRFTIDHQIAEVKRELALRSQVYPNLVRNGKMKQAEADLCTGRMQAVLTTLEYMRENRHVIVAAVAASRVVE